MKIRRQKLFGIGLGNSFLDITLKESKVKLNIKLKSFCKAKVRISKMKKPLMKWKKIFANHLSDNGLMSIISMELI